MIRTPANPTPADTTPSLEGLAGKVVTEAK